MTNASAAVPTFLERLTSYPLVKYSCETTLHFYNEAKEKNNYVKRGLELAETSVGTVAASPLVLNVSKSCEPLLAKADQFGCSQLDRAEASIFKPAAQLYTTANATLASSKKIVEEKVADSKKLVTEKVVQPISATYQHLVALPTVLTNQVFDFAQDSVDYYLPEAADSEKDASLAQAEEAVPQPQEANNNVKTKSVWARSTTLTQCAYRRVQRKASHRVRIARLYGESVLTKSPLAVSVVNYVRTRDPEIRDNLVQQAKATTTYYSDKTKDFVAERPLFKQATAFVEPYLANLSYQSFYSLLLTILAIVAPTKSAEQQSTTATSASSSSAAVETESTEEKGNTDDTVDGIDEEEENGEEETSGPAEPEHLSDEEEEEEKEGKNVDDDELAEDVAEHDERPQANADELIDDGDHDDEVTVDY
jgi:hypothetical protein